MHAKPRRRVDFDNTVSTREERLFLQQITHTEEPGAAAKRKTKSETLLGKAERLVREGQSIVMRQRTVVLALAKEQQNIKEAERLLATFEATLNDLRKELYGINRGK